MQWCQGLDADYGVDPWIWQSLHGPSFHLSSKPCLCNSFHECFVPTSKEGHSVHTSVFIFLSFMCLENCILYLGYPRFWANIHLSVSTYCWSSLIHLDLTLVQGDKNGSFRILLHDNHQLCQHHLLKSPET